MSAISGSGTGPCSPNPCACDSGDPAPMKTACPPPTAMASAAEFWRQQLERPGVLDGKGIPGRFHATGQVKVREQDLVGQLGGRFLQNTRWRSVPASKNADSACPDSDTRIRTLVHFSLKKRKNQGRAGSSQRHPGLGRSPGVRTRGSIALRFDSKLDSGNRHNRTRPYLDVLYGCQSEQLKKYERPVGPEPAHDRGNGLSSSWRSRMISGE